MDRDSKTLTQRPRPLSLEDYEEGRERIVDHFADREGVIGIYDYGTVKHPGISDLDVMLVFDPKTRPDWLDNLSSSFDPLVDELVGRGNIIILDLDTFRRIHYVDPGLEAQHLAGKNISQQTIGPEMQNYRNYASIMDWLPERLYQVERLYNSGTIPVMRALQLLKSLGYSLRIVHDAIGYQDGIAFAGYVENVRASWFDHSDVDRRREMLGAIERARQVGYQALLEWFRASPDGMFEDFEEDPTPGILSYFDGLVYSTGKFGVDEQDGWTCIGIPSPWFDHYRAYANHESRLGVLIRRSMVSKRKNPTALNKKYISYLGQKITVCAKNFRCVKSLSLESGVFRFGFLVNRDNWDVQEFYALHERIKEL
ncbi:hypothetical protein [Salinibacter ruber]|uniref:hypothetical protein n=1 Tax=Salinibacter ruber TaxID=146919 RepID=UPI002169980D|nr:hypothetical protein [Salinibacter ruber]MCS3696428.1 hypothetical protein [Salinibacter ruber]